MVRGGLVCSHEGIVRADERVPDQALRPSELAVSCRRAAEAAVLEPELFGESSRLGTVDANAWLERGAPAGDAGPTGARAYLAIMRSPDPGERTEQTVEPKIRQEHPGATIASDAERRLGTAGYAVCLRGFLPDDQVLPSAMRSNAANAGFFSPPAEIRPDCQPFRFVSSLSRNQSIMPIRGFARAIAKAVFK